MPVVAVPPNKLPPEVDAGAPNAGLEPNAEVAGVVEPKPVPGTVSELSLSECPEFGVVIMMDGGWGAIGELKVTPVPVFEPGRCKGVAMFGDGGRNEGMKEKVSAMSVTYQSSQIHRTCFHLPQTGCHQRYCCLRRSRCLWRCRNLFVSVLVCSDQSTCPLESSIAVHLDHLMLFRVISCIPVVVVLLLFAPKPVKGVDCWLVDEPNPPKPVEPNDMATPGPKGLRMVEGFTQTEMNPEKSTSTPG